MVDRMLGTVCTCAYLSCSVCHMPTCGFLARVENIQQWTPQIY